MKVRTLCIVVMTSVLYVGCGDDDSKREAAIASQALPLSIADKPAEIQLPRWQNMANPHIYIQNQNGKVIFYSPYNPWNGHIMIIYYVPRDDVEEYSGRYALHSTVPLQRIATTRIGKDGTWSAIWGIRGHELPKVFYVMARTDVNQTTLEKVTWHDHALRITGGENVQQ